MKENRVNVFLVKLIKKLLKEVLERRRGVNGNRRKHGMSGAKKRNRKG